MRLSTAALLLLPLLPIAAYAQGAPDPAAGKALWEGNDTQCKNCHGKLGEGAFGPDLAGRGLSAAQFSQAVRKPWGVMPIFIDSQVSDAELASMAAYFGSLPKNAETGPWRTPMKDGMPAGQQAFISAGCGQCHGATFDMPRASLGGANADFATFRDLVYNHTTALEPFDAAFGPRPAPPGNRPPPRIHMGNFVPLRISEAQLQQMFDWAKNDLGYRPMLQARLSAPQGATYTLNVANNGIKGKGVVAQGLTIDLVVPAGTTVTAATGDGYKGVHADAAAKGDVAEWQVAKMGPKDTASFTITLSKTAEPNALKGSIRWVKPSPKSGPNMDVQNIMPPPAGM